MPSQRHKRKLSNYLLQPLLQVKLGFFAIVLSLGFSLLLMSVMYLNFYRLYDLVLELTDLRTEVMMILNNYLRELMTWLIGGTLIYVLLTIAVSIFFTHRLVGPTYAFRRHIQELNKGNYKSRVCLRKSDAFAEVAEDLNQLAETLETRSSRESRLAAE